jgi:Tfp pilus assembly protein PilO
MMRKFDFIPRGIVVKAVLAVVLVVISVILLLTDQDLVRENKKMLKLIKNEEKLRRNFSKLQQSETIFAQYYIPLDSKSDPEKIKADSIASIMKIIEASNLKVDSYRSEVEEAGEFTLFKYNITIVGKYPDAARFFSSLARDARNINVAAYTIQYHIETSVRVGLQVELVGVRSK